MIIFSIVSAHAQLSTHCACAVKIDSTFQIAPMTLGIGTDVGTPPLYQNNNATTPAIQLPFDFCFYGHRYDSVFISNNGIISFLGPIFTFIDSTQQIPLGADTAIIAPFYADANTLNDMGVVYYKVTPTHMIVIWDSVRYAGTDVDGWNTFQLTITNGSDPILPSGNNVAFCYPIMQWCCSDSSGGFSGYGGTAAFVGINKGDGVNYAQISTFFTKLITSARYCHFLLVFGSRFVLSFLSLTVERLALICSRGLDSASVVSGRSVQGDLSHRQSRGKRARPQRILFRSGTPTGLYELLLS